MRFVLALAAAIGLLSGTAAAGPFEDGLAAFEQKDYQGALRYWQPLAEAGSAPAQFAIGVAYASGFGVPRSLPTAARWFRLAADQGLAEAQVNLGKLLEFGDGVARDVAEANKWYRRAAEQGHAVGQNQLGGSYEMGIGFAKDDAEALRWYRLAADQGLPAAQTNLGRMYDRGRGVPADPTAAARWYGLAAAQGDARAQQLLGELHVAGRGLPKDLAEGYRWLRRAAEQGNASAQNHIGAFYEYGRVVRQDFVMAHAWYNIAASQSTAGDPTGAARNRDALAARMTPDQIAAAQALARNWKPASKALPRAAAAAPPGPQSPPPGPSREVVTEAQRHLARLGFDPGPVDGVDGPGTRRAVEGYQRSRSIKVTGLVDDALLKHLRADKASVARAAAPAAPSKAAPEHPLLGTASGFYVSTAGHLLTNWHVASRCGTIGVTKPGNPPVAAALVASDEQHDLALLKTKARPAAIGRFRAGAPPRLGEPVVVFGFPLAGGLASSGNLVTGTLAALAGIGDNPAHYQITAPLQPGNSGGPLLDDGANVIGVIVAALPQNELARSLIGTMPQNVNFAIKGAVAISFLEAHGVAATFADNDTKRTPVEAAELSRDFTVRVDCWR